MSAELCDRIIIPMVMILKGTDQIMKMIAQQLGAAMAAHQQG